MKKLISVADVEQALKDNQLSICIDDTTLITPAAKDLAKSKGISFTTGVAVEKACCNANAPVETKVTEPLAVDGGQALELVKQILINKIGGQALPVDGLIRDRDGQSGFQIVRCQNVEFDVFDTGIPGANVYYKELIGSADSPNISCGFLKIIQSSFPWQLCYDEMDIVLEGELSLTINGVLHKAKAGDVVYVPKGSDVIWGADEYVKLFYVTYPSNWAETM